MKGLSLVLDKQDTYLDLEISPLVVEEKLDLKALLKFFNTSDYNKFELYEENLQNLLSAYKQALKSNSAGPVRECIAERKDAEAKFRLESDELAAFLTIKAPFGGKIPSLEALLNDAKKVGIVRGLSRKKLKLALIEIQQAAPGEVIEKLVAKGLPPKNGRSSKLQPLVPNALERILKPQASDSSRVDMRNLGDIICVKAGTEVLRRLPPTTGRAGFTVTGTTIEPKGGEWVKLTAGDGTDISDSDENLLIANITGMPKFKDGKMRIDDTFTCNGVNVGTGNINYDGAVLVNGDVTEKMVIKASGDVTINGFVESATIEAGGDIIITEGAMGKVDDASTSFSTTLISQGNIHVQHGQGLDVHCFGNVTIGRQLAYSRIVCGGSVTVGPVDNPNGNLFACEIQSHSGIYAGTLGAVSGSNLSIDFSAGFNSLLERKDSLDELLTQLKQNNARHWDKMSQIRSKKIHADLKHKFELAEELLRNETQLLQWLEAKALYMRAAKDKYQEDIKLIANKRLYPGVVVKLNNRTWRAEREYARAKIHYEDHQWKYDPIM